MMQRYFAAGDDSASSYMRFNSTLYHVQILQGTYRIMSREYNAVHITERTNSGQS